MTSIRPGIRALMRVLCLTALLYGIATTPVAAEDSGNALVVVQDRAWAPFAFVDQSGEPRGLLIDLWRAVGEELGRPVRFELTDWQQTLELAGSGEGYVHGGLFQSPERQQYLDFSQELLALRTALFVVADDSMSSVLDVRDLNGIEIGVTAGGFEEEFMREQHPGIPLRTFANNERLVRAATRGEVKGFVADYPVGMYYLDRHTTPERFRVLNVLYTHPLKAAVAKGDNALLAEVNQGLNLLSPADRTRITQKWLRSERVETLPAWLFPALAAAGVLTALLWLLLHNRLLRRQVLRQTRALADRERRLTLLTDNITDVVWSVGPDRRYTYVSPSIQRLTGYRSEEIVGKRMGGTITAESVETLTRKIREARDLVRAGQLSGHADFMVEAQLLRTDGEPLWTEVNSRVFFDETGRFAGMQGVTREITERRRSQETIERLAYYDSLTRLPNRRLLTERIDQARTASARAGEYGALLFLDLDNFKTLNDTQGHDIGDMLLQHVAERLMGTVRDSDTVARLGGDEFVVVLASMGRSGEEALRNAERVAGGLLRKLSEPYSLAGRQVHTSSSIGASVFLGTAETTDTLLKQSDMAMYEAKIAGRNTVCFYDPSMQAAVDARATLEQDLRQAIQHKQFTLYFQPQVDDQGRTTGAEALLRWHHPQRGLILPGEFISLAEETNLIAPLGQWVLEAACEQLERWSRDEATAGLTLSVNVSARQFERPAFVEEVLQALEQTGARPRLLKLELTESSILRDVEGAIAKMASLRAQGVGFALDDFGTGYSSLSYLKRLPLDQLKIDKSFVHHVLTDEDDAAIAQTVIALGCTLNLPVIAEGVETADQQAFLARHGCFAFQGYLFGAPEPPEVFRARLPQARKSSQESA